MATTLAESDFQRVAVAVPQLKTLDDAVTELQRQIDRYKTTITQARERRTAAQPIADDRLPGFQIIPGTSCFFCASEIIFSDSVYFRPATGTKDSMTQGHDFVVCFGEAMEDINAGVTVEAPF